MTGTPTEVTEGIRCMLMRGGTSKGAYFVSWARLTLGKSMGSAAAIR
jgi:hypothetical protein